MNDRSHNSTRYGKQRVALALLVVLMLASVSFAFAGDKKKKEPEKVVPVIDQIDTSKLVWPQPPNIARVKYLTYFAGEKLPDFNAKKVKSKSAWMDRLAGTNSSTDSAGGMMQNHFFMGEPHGMGVDSTGKLYVADGKVGAVFIIDPETHDTEMIKNGKEANFSLIVGVAIDDSDKLFVSDGQANCVLVFDKRHHLETTIREGLVTPNGLALDVENRFLYVADLGAGPNRGVRRRHLQTVAQNWHRRHETCLRSSWRLCQTHRCCRG